MIFAYVDGRRCFAWEVEALSLDSRNRLTFFDSSQTGARQVYFRRGHTRNGQSDVRPTFFHKHGEAGQGESLTHLLFKEAFLAISEITFSGPFSNPIRIIFSNTAVEHPLYIDPKTTLRLDVLASISSPQGLIEYWGDQIGIEIEHTHQTESLKKHFLYQRRVPCIEISVPPDLIIEDEENITESEVHAHSKRCIAHLKNTLPAKLISHPITERYLQRQTADMLRKIETKNAEIGRLTNTHSELIKENKRLTMELAESLKAIKVHADHLKQKNDEAARLSSKLVHLANRTWWQRLLNLDAENKN